MSSSSGPMAGYPADDSPSPLEQKRQSAKRELDNLYFLTRHSSEEATHNVQWLLEVGHELSVWLDANRYATRDEFEAKQKEMQNEMNELLLRQIEAAGKRRKLEDQ